MKKSDEIKKAVSLCILSECCEACPYHGDVSCSTMLMLDVFACIEQLESRGEQKNRILTLEEVKAHCEGGADAAPLWYDGKDYSDANRWMIIDLPEFAFGSMATVKYLANTQFFAATYGEKWRCWLRKPTKEEMEGTPWEGDSRE